MSEWIANCAVSMPVSLPGVRVDVDMGGVKFSTAVGLFYAPTTKQLPIRLPPPFEGEA